MEGEELNSGEYTAPSESSVETFNQNVGSVRSPSPDKTAAVKHVQVAGKPVQAPGKYTSYKAPPPSLTKCSNLQRQIDTPPKVMSWAARASANSGNYRASYQRSNDCDGLAFYEVLVGVVDGWGGGGGRGRGGGGGRGRDGGRGRGGRGRVLVVVELGVGVVVYRTYYITLVL